MWISDKQPKLKLLSMKKIKSIGLGTPPKDRNTLSQITTLKHNYPIVFITTRPTLTFKSSKIGNESKNNLNNNIDNYCLNEI